VRAQTGADGVAAIAEGVGALTLLAALLRGTEGISSAVALGAATHVSVPNAKQLGRGLDDELSLQRGDRLAGRIADRFLKLQRMQKEERCASPVCRRASYVYGLLYEHDQLNRATHETLHELLSLPSRSAMAHLRRIAQQGRLLAADGGDVYLPRLGELAIPLTFVHGAESETFRAEGTQTSVAALRESIDPELVALHLVDDYGHLDLVIGKDAERDVFPLLLDHLERTATRKSELLEA
jgi:cholesterol oxidase